MFRYNLGKEKLISKKFLFLSTQNQFGKNGVECGKHFGDIDVVGNYSYAPDLHA